MRDGQRDTLNRERKEYQEKEGNNKYGGNKRSIEKIKTEIDLYDISFLMIYHPGHIS